MRARDRGRALAQIVALGAALAVVCAVAPGTAGAEPETRQQQQQPQQKRVFKMVVVGDSFSAGQGVRGPSNGRVEPRIYFDAADPRHQSTESAAIQAAARLQAANPGLKVEVTIVASSGAVTTDVFETQRRDPLETIPGNTTQNPTDPGTWRDENDLAVSTRQLDQVPADADAVVVGLGGNDVYFAPMIRSLIPGAPEDTASVLGKANPLLDNTLSDQAYRDQAEQGKIDNTPGHEPTLVARLLQVMAAIQEKAPNAKMFLQNYPAAVDPEKTSLNSPLDSDELAAMGKFGEQVNAAIKRAAEICGCADLVDVSGALHGRELYSRDPAMNDLSKAFSLSNDPNWDKDEAAHPNIKGASLMSDHINETVAKKFGLKVPPRKGDRRTDIRDITIKNTPAPDTDGDGEPDYRDKDWDGDGTPNTEDRTPNQTPRPQTGPTDPPTNTPPDTTTPTTRPDPSPAPASPQQQNPAPPSPAPQQPNPAPPQQPGPAPQQPSPAPPQQSPPGSQPNPAPSPQPSPGQQPSPTPQPNPAPPQQSNPAPQPNPAPQQQPNQAPRTSSGSSRPPVIPPTTPMRSPAAPSMPKPPSAPSLQGSIGPRGSQPAPIDRLGTPPPPPTVTVPSPPTKNPYPLGGSKPPMDSSGGAGSSAPPPLPQKAPPPPPPPSDSFVGA